MSKLKKSSSSRYLVPKPHPGFTLVELLVVIVVIAILAAVSVVAYNGIQNRASDSIVQHDMDQFLKQTQLRLVEDDSLLLHKYNYDNNLQDNAEIMDWLNTNFKPSLSSYRAEERYPLMALIEHYGDYGAVEFGGVSKSGKVFSGSTSDGKARRIHNWDSEIEHLEEYLGAIQAELDRVRTDEPGEIEWIEWLEDELQRQQKQLSSAKTNKQNGSDLWSMPQTLESNPYPSHYLGEHYYYGQEMYAYPSLYNDCKTYAVFDTSYNKWVSLYRYCDQ